MLEKQKNNDVRRSDVREKSTSSVFSRDGKETNSSF